MGEDNSGKISLKLLVDRNANRVIFGEAGKDFVDFLFQFLSLPVGTVVKLLSKDKMVGSLGKIYESIEEMPAKYMQPNMKTKHVLKASDDTPKVFDQCDSDNDTECDSDHDIGSHLLHTLVSDDEIGNWKGGYVKDLVNYMVMDDLVVKPMSTISSFTLISNVKDMRAVETLEVYIGKNEAVDLLKASFVTNRVLSSVFVGNQKI